MRIAHYSAVAAIYAALIGSSFGQMPPDWWSWGDPPVTASGAVVNNKGAANIGQGKWMAKNALEALRVVDPATAALVEADLVGPGKIIPGWAAPVTQAEKDAQRHPLLIGQLKAIATPFYDHLHANHSTWLADQRVINDTQNSGTHFPWTLSTSDDLNKAAANIGQLKAVFSLRFEELGDLEIYPPDLEPDSDGDGMPDAWETQNGLDPLNREDGQADHDNDGLPNLTEYKLGTSPTGYYRMNSALLEVQTSQEDFYHDSNGSGLVLVSGISNGPSEFYLLESSENGLTRGPNFSALQAYNAAIGRLADDGSVNAENLASTFSNDFYLYKDLAGQNIHKSWDQILADLYAQDVPPVASRPLFPYAIVSPTGALRLYRDAAKAYLFLGSDGELSWMAAPPKDHLGWTDIVWDTISDYGHAVAIRRDIENGGSHQMTNLLWWDGSAVSVVRLDQGAGDAGYYTLGALSNQSSIMVRRFLYNGGNSVTDNRILDLPAATFTEVKKPDDGHYYISKFSRNGQRGIVTGLRQGQLTPWGTILPLDKLWLRQEFGAETYQRMSYDGYSVQDISDGGIITMTGLDESGNKVITQLYPDNDFDNDGLPDDWEKWWSMQLEASGRTFTNEEWMGILWGDLSPDGTYGDSVTTEESYRSRAWLVEVNGAFVLWPQREMWHQSRNFYQKSFVFFPAMSDYPTYPGTSLTMFEHSGPFPEDPENYDDGVSHDFLTEAAFTPSAVLGRFDSFRPWIGNTASYATKSLTIPLKGATTILPPKEVPVTNPTGTDYFSQAHHTRFKYKIPFPARKAASFDFLSIKREKGATAANYPGLGWYLPITATGTDVVTIRNASISIGLSISGWFDISPEFKANKVVEEMVFPLEVNAPTLYMFSGNTKDEVALCSPRASGMVTCQWRLRNPAAAVGTFDQPTDLACKFTATSPGVNVIELVIDGAVVWEKDVEVLEIKSRASWGALPIELAHMSGAMDIAGVTYHHTSNINTGPAEMRRIQRMHMGKGFTLHDNWGDIGYHFVMDKDGTIYEGRQLESAPGSPGGPYTRGAHVDGKNTPAGIGICVMGDYESEAFPAARQKHLEKLISAVCRRYKLFHNQVDYHRARAFVPPVTNSSECPGANIISKSSDILDNIFENLQ